MNQSIKSSDYCFYWGSNFSWVELTFDGQEALQTIRNIIIQSEVKM